jgi:tRNA1(Val) A37 N6-methylase TrmN6
MARLEAIAKALYYPTDLRVLGVFIKHHLKLGGVQANWGSILDPCCGTGEAVAFIRDQLQAIGRATVEEITSKPSYQRSSYGYGQPALRPEWEWVAKGVELDEQRAEAAREWLGEKNIIHAALEQMSKPPLRSTMFDILFLNPPYDDVGGKREELRFLRMATPFLSSGGLAILVLPDRFVDGGSHSARLLNTLRSLGLNQSIRVFKFPEPEYQQFKQVIIVASKGRPHSYMAKKDLEIDGVIGEYADGPGTRRDGGSIRGPERHGAQDQGRPAPAHPRL